MEDQKLLWIVFSVVLFAVVVLASVLYFLKPKPGEPVLATTEQTSGAGFDTYEYVRGTSVVPPLEQGTKPAESLQIVVGEEPSSRVAAPAAGAPAAQTEPRPVDQPKPASSAPATPRPAAEKVVPPRPASSGGSTSTKPTKPAAKTPAQPTRLYWIQAASFKSRNGAEAMVSTLGEKGVTGRVQVSDVGGQAYYRVRVGPYTSREEADKFLAWIKGVKGLEQSYISVVSKAEE